MKINYSNTVHSRAYNELYDPIYRLLQSICWMGVIEPDESFWNIEEAL